MANPFKKNVKVVFKKIDGKLWFKFNNDFEIIKHFYGNIISVLLIVVLVAIAVVMFWKVLPYINLLRINPCQLCEDLGFACKNFLG